MAGGKIVRIAGGKIIERYKNLTYYQNNFTINAGGKIELTTDGEMIYGDPEEPKAGKYFIKGWWTDREDKPLLEAYVEDWVKFHIKTNITKGEKITFKILDYDGPLLANDELTINEWYPGQELIVDEDGMAYIEWKLGMGTASLIKSESWDSKIEFFVRCTYKEETVDLADKESTWLNVTLPPKKEKIVFVQASDIHELPEMYDAKTGDIYYIARKNLMYANKIKGVNQSISNPSKLNLAEKKAYEVAVRRLEKGTMVMTYGKVTTTKRLYEYEVSNLDKTFTKKIKMGVNFAGTKGLNQLEAVADVTTPVKLLKTVGQIMRVAGALTDMASMARAQANGELPPIPYMPPFVVMEVDKIVEGANDEMRIMFYRDLRQAIAEGKEKTKDYFRKRKHYGEEITMGFEFIALTENALFSILDNQLQYISSERPQEIDGRKIQSIYSLDLDGSGVDDDCGMVVQTVHNDRLDEYGRDSTTHYIHALFLPKIIGK